VVGVEGKKYLIVAMRNGKLTLNGEKEDINRILSELKRRGVETEKIFESWCG